MEIEDIRFLVICDKYSHKTEPALQIKVDGQWDYVKMKEIKDIDDEYFKD